MNSKPGDSIEGFDIFLSFLIEKREPKKND